MKQFLIPMMILFLGISVSCNLNAQKDEKEKKVTIKIEKEVDGKTTLVDTTFTLKEGEDLSEILEKYGVKADIHSKHAKEFDVDIEMDDSLDKEEHAMVWVTVGDDDEVHKHKIKAKGKNMVFVTEDDGVKIIELNGDDDTQEEDVIIEKLDGDSIKVKKKIIIKTGKDKEHKHLKKMYKVPADSTKKGKHVFIISDDCDDEGLIWNEKGGKGDSVEVIIKKIKKDKAGKHGKHIYITTDGDYTWTTDEDIIVTGKDGKFKKVKVEILDTDESDLKLLKLKNNYEELELTDFFLFIKEDKEKMDIKFTISEKGNLKIKIVDMKGKEVFADSESNFEGKYKKEIKALKGDFILDVSVGKKHYVKKLMLDWGNK